MRAATFTTYHTVQLDPKIESAFDRQARAAQQSYGTITRAADAASRATAGLLGGKGTAGLGTGTRALRERTTATEAAGRAAVATTERTTRLATATRREAEAAGAAAAANQRFARSLGTTATALAVVQGPLGPLSGKLRAASSAMGELTGFTLGLAGLGVALFSIGRTATGFQQIENKLRPLFDTQTQVNKAMDDVVGIATRARTALEPVSSLYMRLTGAAKELAISQSQVGRYTEIISKGAVLSGGSRESQAAGIQQLTQGLGSGLLAGDELRSVKENTFALAQAIAAGFKNADGTIGTTIGHLKELGSAGQLTARQVLEALDRSAYDIERRYAKLPKTLVTSGQEFGNAFMVTIGRLDSAAGFTSTIAEGLSLVSQNLRVILSLAAGVGTAFAAVKAIEMGRTTVTNVGARFRALQQEAVMLRGNAILDRAFAAEAVQNETVRAQATAHSVVGLRAEGAAIESNIAALRAQAVQARETAAAAAASRFGRVAAPGAGPAGISTEQARLRAAAATKALATEEARLAQIHAALLAEERLLTVQTGALTIATQNLARAQMTEAAVSTGRLATGMRFLRTAGMGLVSMLGGPLMIAFTAITAAIYLFVTAETAAEAATRRNEDAQRDFERSIDKTTGKIYEQIGALELQAKAKQQTVAVESSIEQWKHERGQLFARVMPFLQRRRENDFFRPDKAQAEAAFQNRPQAQKDLAAALTRFRDGGSLGEFEKEIRRLAPAIKGLGTALPELGEAAGRVRERAIETDQALARRRVIIGKAKPGDLGVALGTITPGQQIRRKSKAELDREAASQAQIEATNPLIAATGRKNAGLLALEQQRDATGMTDQEYLDQRKQIIATYNSEVKGIQDAKKAQAQARSEEKKAIREARAEEKRAVQEREADEKDEAAGRRDAALLALEERKASLGGDASPEYLNARLAILKTYDDEMERIDSTGQASSTAAARLIADARAIQKAAAAAGEKRRDILGGYGDQPKALARAADQIDDLQRMVNTAVDGVAFLGKTRDEIEQISELNPLGTGIYTQEMLDADRRRIEEGVRKPLRDIQRDHEREMAVATLMLEGREAEATALRQTYSLVDDIGRVEQSTFDQLVRNVEQQERINALLESRSRITSLIEGTVDEMRDGFEQFLTDLPTRGPKAAGDLFKTVSARLAQINARALTERIFAGADEKVKALISGRSAVESSTRHFAGQMSTTADSAAILANANRHAASVITDSANSLAQAVQAAASAAVAPPPAAPVSGTPVEAASQSIVRMLTSSLGKPATYKPGTRIGAGIGDDVIFRALGAAAVITENLRTQAQQDSYRARGWTKAKVSTHTTTQDAWDVRLPRGMSFSEADRLIRQTAATMGARVVSSLDETKPGMGSAPHGHFVIVGPDGSRMTLERTATAGARPAATPNVSSNLASLVETVSALTGVIAGSAPGSSSSSGQSYIHGSFADITSDPALDGQIGAGAKRSTPSGAQVYNQIFSTLGAGLDRVVDKIKGRKPGSDGTVLDKEGNLVTGSTFFKKMGSTFGDALQGAGEGAIASGFVKALGVKQSNLGAQVGGAGGRMAATALGLPPELGGFVGGIIGGTVGGLFKKAKTGAATVTLDGNGNLSTGTAFGNSKAMMKAATGAAGTVVDGLNSIAEALGAEITGSPNLTIGQKDGKYRVNTRGTSLKTKKGAVDFGEDAEAAVEYAIRYAVEHAVITGISQASVNILKSGQDLQKAIEKATLIESIPKRLMQRTDPVRYAVSTLNDEFEKIIRVLKEGSATAEQFADAQKLYEFERADAIQQATQQASAAIDQFIKDMIGGANSPLNKRTTYENAASALEGFKGNISAGKAVDQNELLSAARNFQDASRALNGSSLAFFDDFDMLRSLLEKARDNAGVTNVSTLPASPFSSDSSVMAAIASLQNANATATQGQTDQIVAKLDQLIGAIVGRGGGKAGGGGGGSAIMLLPGSGRSMNELVREA